MDMRSTTWRRESQCSIIAMRIPALMLEIASVKILNIVAAHSPKKLLQRRSLTEEFHKHAQSACHCRGDMKQDSTRRAHSRSCVITATRIPALMLEAASLKILNIVAAHSPKKILQRRYLSTSMGIMIVSSSSSSLGSTRECAEAM